jgi:hypothetical protein
MSSPLFHSTSHLSIFLKLHGISRDRQGRERLRLRDLPVEQWLNRRSSSVQPGRWSHGQVRAVAVASGLGNAKVGLLIWGGDGADWAEKSDRFGAQMRSCERNLVFQLNFNFFFS